MTLAQATDGSLLGPTSAPAVPPPQPSVFVQIFSSPLFPLALLILFMYVFVFRSKKKEENKRETMLKALKKGDRIQTIGGLLGTVVDAREDEVVVKVDETANVKLRFIRSAIHKVIEPESDTK